MPRSPSALLNLLTMLALSSGAALAQVPPEVPGVAFSDQATLGWSTVGGADFYNVYRGGLGGVDSSDPGRCHGFDIATTSFSSAQEPAAAGEGYFYLVTAESLLNGEGTPGSASGGPERTLLASCTPFMQSHVLNRAGYGWDEWSRDELTSLGVQAYLAAQLDPTSIPESATLTTKLAAWDPPTDIFGMIAQQVLRATYSHRQLEQQMAAFWANHFSTYWPKVVQVFQSVYPDPGDAEEQASLYQYREIESFRFRAFNRNFREIVEASALSPAMILYLDNFTNIVGVPNENYARELLELGTMGVDGGYTQTDVEELARILTGWTICRKQLADLGNRHETSCDSTPPAEWDAFVSLSYHDCGAKTLFAGTPQEVSFPGSFTCSTPSDSTFAIQELEAALDAIVAHPSTPRFIARKMLQLLVTEEPTEPMIDVLEDEWNDGGNLRGVGDLREATRAALNMSEFLDPDRVQSKIKTPFEQFVGGFRAMRGDTDGVTVITTQLLTAQNLPHYNEEPTGYSELGGDWLDTGGTLARQNFGYYLGVCGPPGIGPCAAFTSDPISLLNDNGVSTAPGNTEAIVDYLAAVLFGGAWTPVERQIALDFLNTDNLGSPSPYDDGRIRETVGLLLGYAQFQEQ